eukprot:GDKK01076437.1.p1 GENE.GDKK01076437.1~~GDKK01076437.1.p1  ORF type:complete len:166 (-),score=1.91 GDKK01076437.1:248-745(-)
MDVNTTISHLLRDAREFAAEPQNFVLLKPKKGIMALPLNLGNSCNHDQYSLERNSPLSGSPSANSSVAFTVMPSPRHLTSMQMVAVPSTNPLQSPKPKSAVFGQSPKSSPSKPSHSSSNEVISPSNSVCLMPALTPRGAQQAQLQTSVNREANPVTFPPISPRHH